MISIAQIIGILSFVLLILMSILGFLVGFYKGLLKTGIKTILKIVFIIIWIFSTGAISKTISNIDLTRFNFQNININGSEIKVTSIAETIANIITALNLLSPMNGLSVYSLAITISELFVCYLVFLLLMILTQLFISGITGIVYNGVFRWFIQVESFSENIDRLKYEKEYKENSDQLSLLTKGLINYDGSISPKRIKKPLMKFGGGILGFVQEFLFILILFSPVTSLIRTINMNKEDLINFINRVHPEEFEFINKTDSFTTDYYKSPLFSLYTLPNNLYLDDLIMDKVTEINIYNTKVSFDSFVTSIVDVANPLISKGIFNYEEGLASVTTNFSTLLSISTIQSIINAMLLPKNQSFFALIPPTIDIGLAIITANTDFRLDTLDFSNIDWRNDIKAIEEVYSQVYSKMINSIVAGKEITPYEFFMPTSIYSDNDISALENVAKILGNTDLIKKNAPVIFSSLGTTLSANGYDIFPTYKEAYDDINWGEEFSLYSYAFFNLLRIIDINIEANMNFTLIQDNLINALLDDYKRHQIQELLMGDNGLINSKLLQIINKGNALLSIVDSLITSDYSNLSKYTSLESFRNEVIELNHKNIYQLKNEINSLFSIINIISNKNNPLHFNDDFSLNSIDSFDDGIAEELYTLLQIAKESSIFSALYPNITKMYLSNNFSEDGVKKYLLGLSPYNFNYEDTEFIDDFSKIVLVLPKISKLYESINNNEDNLTVINSIDIESLRTFLKVLVNSNFFNPPNKYIQNNIDLKNINIEIVLKKLFSLDFIKKFGLKVPTRDKIASANWGNGDTFSYLLENGESIILPNDEIAAICSLFENIKKNPDFFSFDLENIKLIYFDYVDDFDSLLDLGATIINSQLFKEEGINVFCDKLDRYLQKNNIPFNFNDLRNYAYEDKNKYKIINDLVSYKDLSKILDDIEYLQLSSSNITYLRELPLEYFNIPLTYIASSNFAKDNKDDIIADVIYLFGHKFNFYKKYNIPDYSKYIFDINNYAIYNSVWIKEKEKVDFNINDENIIAYYTTDGSIRNLCSLFDVIRKHLYVSKLKQRDYSNLDIRTWIVSEIDREENILNSGVFSDMFIRKLFDIYSPYIFKKAFKIMPKLPPYIYDIYLSIDDNLLFGTNALNGLKLGNELYNLNELFLILTTRVNDNELVFDYFKDIEKFLNIGEISFDDKDIVNALSNSLRYISNTTLLSTKEDNSIFTPLSCGIYNLLSNNDELLKQIVLGSDNKETNLKSLKQILTDIDNKNSLNNQTTSWNNELKYYANIFDNIINQNFSINDYSLISPTKTQERLQTIYDNLNNSALLHKVVISRIKTVYNLFNLDKYIVNKNNIIIYPTNFNVALTNSINDVNYWKNDYTLLFDLISKDNENINNIFISSSIPTFLDKNNIELTYYLGSMNLFRNSNKYLFYNLLKNSSSNLINYLNNPNKYYFNEDDKAMRINEIIYNNSLLFNDNKFSIYSSNYEKEIECLKNVLSLLEEKNNITITNINDIKNNFNNNFFNNLFASTVNNSYRSYLSSDIVAGFITKIMNTSDDIKSFFNEYASYNYYENNYQNITSNIGTNIDNIINS